MNLAELEIEGPHRESRNKRVRQSSCGLEKPILNVDNFIFPLFAFLVLSGFFAISETAILASNKYKIRTSLERQQTRSETDRLARFTRPITGHIALGKQLRQHRSSQYFRRHRFAIRRQS
jgi:hypothetical protein